MPRISPSMVRAVGRTNPFLRLLLPACRTFEQASLEFKWISEEISSSKGSSSRTELRKAIYNACLRRSRLVPLQYILGSQPFGSLDIICRRGVLIPRWETEEWSYEFAQRIKSNVSELEKRIIIWDLCAGSGCIALLLKHELQKYKLLEVMATDCSQRAIDLIKRNMAHNGLTDISVIEADIIKKPPTSIAKVHILVCNPPYISEESFVKETSRSVKIYEPRLALVGNKEFYQNLIDHWLPKIDAFVYEIGDIDQAVFVNNVVKKDKMLSTIWSIGVRCDANDKPRVVYGFKKSANGNPSFNYCDIFHEFGELMN